MLTGFMKNISAISFSNPDRKKENGTRKEKKNRDCLNER